MTSFILLTFRPFQIFWFLLFVLFTSFTLIELQNQQGKYTYGQNMYN